MNNTPPTVRMQHTRNRTATGKRTTTPARQAATYFAFGRQTQQPNGRQRGEWLGSDGKLHNHEAVLAWAKGQARQHEHTFQALLSVQQARLSDQDYMTALNVAGQIGDWRLVVHNDTNYSHAHVLFFRNQRLPRTQFEQWQQQVQQALSDLEARCLAESEQALTLSEGSHMAAGLEWG